MALADAVASGVTAALRVTGGNVTLRYVVAGDDYDPADGAGDQTTDYVVKGVWDKVAKDVGPGEYGTADRRLIVGTAGLPALPTTPQGLFFVESAREYEVTYVDEIRVGATAVAYILTIKGGL